MKQTFSYVDILQIIATTKASLKVRYRQSIAGFIWVILNPVILLTAQSVAFKYILKLEIENYFLFLASGLLPWIFFSSTCEMTSSSLIQGAKLLKAYPINPIVLSGSQFLENFFNFSIAFFLILVTALIKADRSPFDFFLAIPAVLSLAYGVFILSVLCSIIQVFFRDFKFVLSFVLQVLFFLTPVFYPRDFIPHQFVKILDLNPILHWVEGIRKSINGDVINDHLPITLLVNAVLTAALLIYWKRNKHEIYRYL